MPKNMNLTVIFLYAVVPTIEVTSRTDPRLILSCTTTGAAGVITWAYSGSAQTYANDGGHELVQSLLSGVNSTYESRLTFTQNPYASDTGERACVLTSKYVSTNSSQTTPSTVISKYRKSFMAKNIFVVLFGSKES